jgi:hypothetical protein
MWPCFEWHNIANNYTFFKFPNWNHAWECVHVDVWHYQCIIVVTLVWNNKKTITIGHNPCYEIFSELRVSIWNREEGYYHGPNPWYGVLSQLVMAILFCSRIRKLFENFLPNSRSRPLIKRTIHKQPKLLSLAKQTC